MALVQYSGPQSAHTFTGHGYQIGFDQGIPTWVPSALLTHLPSADFDRVSCEAVGGPSRGRPLLFIAPTNGVQQVLSVQAIAHLATLYPASPLVVVGLPQHLHYPLLGLMGSRRAEFHESISAGQPERYYRQFDLRVSANPDAWGRVHMAAHSYVRLALLATRHYDPTETVPVTKDWGWQDDERTGLLLVHPHPTLVDPIGRLLVGVAEAVTALTGVRVPLLTRPTAAELLRGVRTATCTVIAGWDHLAAMAIHANRESVLVLSPGQKIDKIVQKNFFGFEHAHWTDPLTESPATVTALVNWLRPHIGDHHARDADTRHTRQTSARGAGSVWVDDTAPADAEPDSAEPVGDEADPAASDDSGPPNSRNRRQRKRRAEDGGPDPRAGD